MRSEISALMVKLLPKNLYSRLTLVTAVTLIFGYFVVYAWTTLDPVDAGPTKTLTATLMQGIVNNINDLNTRVSNFSFSSGNVGIGTASPGAKLHVNGNSVFGNPIAIPNDLIPGYIMSQFGKGGVIE